MPRPRRRGFARRGPRKQTIWIDTSINEATAAGTADDANLIVTVPTNLETKGWKIVRCIINLKCMPTSPQGTIGKMMYSMGIGVIEDDAFGAGAVPETNIMADAPASGWLWRAQALVEDHSTDATIGDRTVAVMADIRTARNIGRGTLLWMSNNDTFSGTSFSVDCGGLIRSLYELP